MMDNSGPCSIEGCETPAKCRTFCDKHYTRWRRHGDPLKSYHQRDLTVEDRFWSRVDQTGEHWLWTRYVDSLGYGWFRPDSNGPNRPAHQFACCNVM